MSTIVKVKSVTQKFRDLKIGESLVIECADGSQPHSFAKNAGIKIKTKRCEHQPADGNAYRIKCTRILESERKTAQ